MKDIGDWLLIGQLIAFDYMSKGQKILVALAVCLSLVLAVFSSLQSNSSPPAKGYNLLFISIDTLRADRLGLYGYKRPTSLNLDEFAKQAVVFENAVSVSSWTLPTHMTFFTGLFPSAHGVTRPTRSKISSQTAMFAEITKKNGYRNFAYTGGGYVGARYGFDRGFETYREHQGKKREGSYDITDSLQALKEQLSGLASGEKFFMFLHTFDVHCPYNSPEPYMSMFNSDQAEYIDPYKCGAKFYNQSTLTPANVSYLSDRYDGGIKWVDTQLHELFTVLKERSLLDRTVIIITSDHGEELYDHGSIGHKRSLYRELLNVPLIIYVPGVAPGRISRGVSSVDLFATMVELLGLEGGPTTDGISLWPLIRTKDAQSYSRSFQFSELDNDLVLRSHIDPQAHMINNLKTKDQLYFDLQSDPSEQHDLSDTRQVEINKRLAELEDLERSFKHGKAELLDRQSPEDIERLKSLGYL